MAVIADGLKATGLSKESINLAMKSRRDGTVTNYNSKWRVWVAYCDSRVTQIVPLHPKPRHVANFLAHLYSVKGLQYATLANYRSAITNTIRTSRGCDVSHLADSSLIKSVLDGVKNEFPKKQIQPPLWDVFLVLKFLRSKMFEPLSQSSIKCVSQKTLFLIMLACSRRLSGIHALSGLDKDIEFSRGDKSCTLSFLPEFRAKNQDALSDPQSVEIKSLKDFVCDDDEDRFNCPVRMVKHYLKRTGAYRFGKRKLFVSLNPSLRKDITKNTLAAWLRDLISDAYRDAHLEPPVGASRTHELRKVSTTLGHVANVSMATLMRAAYWRSENTFTSFYLRDIRVKRRDDTYGISKVVVAQSVVSL